MSERSINYYPSALKHQHSPKFSYITVSIIDKVYSQKSTINGTGVFAAKELQPGESILEIDDSRVVSSENRLGEGELSYHCDYLAHGKVVLMQEPERYINHSCDPNTYVKTIDGVRHVMALRQIAKDQEITYDYCINGEGDFVWYCHCGSARCRNRIVSGFFHLPLELQLEYLPLLDTWYLEQYKEELLAFKHK